MTRLDLVNGYTRFENWNRICSDISQQMFHRVVVCCIYAVSSVSNTSYPAVNFPDTRDSFPTQKGRKHKKAVGHHVTAGHHHLSLSRIGIWTWSNVDKQHHSVYVRSGETIQMKFPANNKQQGSAIVESPVPSLLLNTGPCIRWCFVHAAVRFHTLRLRNCSWNTSVVPTHIFTYLQLLATNSSSV